MLVILFILLERKIAAKNVNHCLPRKAWKYQPTGRERPRMQ
jgi:hypothetical protein